MLENLNADAVMTIVLTKLDMLSAELVAKLHAVLLLSAEINWQIIILWWLVAFIGILSLVLLVGYAARGRRYKFSWYYMVYNLLDELEKDLDTKSNHHVITELSKLLRIMAIKQFSRSKCATLTGYEWLAWLTEHDPNSFPWIERGKALISCTNLAGGLPSAGNLPSTSILPSAGSPSSIDSNANNNADINKIVDSDLKDLIMAAKKWVSRRK